MNCKLYVFVFLAVSVFLFCGCRPQQEKASLKVAVVNAEKAMKGHKDWNRLEEIDRKLIDIQVKMQQTSGAAFTQLGEQQAQKMKEAHLKAEKELKEELARVQASMDASRREIEQKMKAEAGKVSGQISELKKQADASAKSGSGLSRDLMMLRDRQIAAKRLELQKQAKERMDSENNRLEAELTAYENQIAKENQQQKLNYQLKLQLNPPEEEQKVIREEMNALSDDEMRLKQKKRDEIAVEIEKIAKQELDRVEKELQVYEAKVDKDIQKQVGVNPSSGEKNVDVTALEKKGQRLAAEFDAKQRALEAQLAGANSQSMMLLEKKQKELRDRLTGLEKEMVAEMEQSRTAMMQSDNEKLQKLQKEMEELQTQRQKLYDSMLSDLRREVESVSKQDGYDLVAMSYIVSVDTTDITDKVISLISGK